jgi:hypothetical protein
MWHGRTKAGDAGVYLDHIRQTGLQEYKATLGNLSAKILRRIDEDVCHFYAITEWKDLESIKRFAGDDYEQAVYYPGDEKYLLEFEENVIHCETFTE